MNAKMQTTTPSPAWAHLRKALRNPWQALVYATALVKSFWYRIKYEKILKKAVFGKRVRINGKLIIRGPGQIIFGDDIRCAGVVTPFTHRSEAVIKIGKKVFLNGTRFGAAKRIEIGSRCILADCRIMDNDFHSLSENRDSAEAAVGVAPVRLGDNVWVGGQAGILKGVTIGENSVIGFGAVVTSDIDANVVAMGNPARAVRKIPD
ncbi:MAG: acyltransferase [Desulfobacteraceae bacterium]|nr:MAG: acyltransferase [Desulfobacteraceae bacterium]